MPAVDPRLLVGPDTMDDAAALKVSDEMAVCFTADFITPVVDDAHLWGRIAAANSLSDIYAMGATPLAALNLVCWPSCLPLDMLRQLLAGGAAAAAEGNCLVVGGHTVDDKQPKYGMAVIGTVHPDRLLRNRGAQPGDKLYLSKPLGTGIIATAVKAEFASREQLDASTQSMATLNRAAAVAAIGGGARALTDVTGFGLAGHLCEMLGHDGCLGAKICMDALPVLPGVRALMDMGMIPGGAYRNRDAYQQRVQLSQGVDQAMEILLYDPQTSGGLLTAVPAERATDFERHAAQNNVPAVPIGEFDSSGKISVS
jgi:selenide,water dikinase